MISKGFAEGFHQRVCGCPHERERKRREHVQVREVIGSERTERMLVVEGPKSKQGLKGPKECGWVHTLGPGLELEPG